MQPPNETIDFGKLTTREINALARKLADTTMREYRNQQMLERGAIMEIAEARRAPVDVLRFAFIELKAKGKLPRSAHFTPFRMAWRGPYTITHGTISGYNQGCRRECPNSPTCSETWAAYQKDRYQKRKKQKQESQAAEAMLPYEEGINTALAGNGTLSNSEREHARSESTTEDRWAGMNGFLRTYPLNQPISMRALDSWYKLAGIRLASEKADWLLHSQIEYREGQMYRKEGETNAA